MNAGSETVHVVFGMSIASTLREALLLLGHADRVIGLANSLSVGPIDPPDPNVRLAWGRSVLGAAFLLPGQLDGESNQIEEAWAAATAPGVDPVFWVCLSAPEEHACFLAFAARMRGRSFDIVDVTDLSITELDGVRSPRSLGMMRAQEIAESDLYVRRRPLPAVEHRAAVEAWSQLERENAPFRIVCDGRLVSAPLTHYDAWLVGLASPDWEIVPRLIGRAFDELFSSHALTGQGTSDAVLFGRILALGGDGTLDVMGSGPSMRDYRVRRAQ